MHLIELLEEKKIESNACKRLRFKKYVKKVSHFVDTSVVVLEKTAHGVCYIPRFFSEALN